MKNKMRCKSYAISSYVDGTQLQLRLGYKKGEIRATIKDHSISFTYTNLSLEDCERIRPFLTEVNLNKFAFDQGFTICVNEERCKMCNDSGEIPLFNRRVKCDCSQVDKDNL